MNNKSNSGSGDVLVMIITFVAFFAIVFFLVFYESDEDKDIKQAKQSVAVNNYAGYVLYEYSTKGIRTYEYLYNPHYFAVVNAVQTEQGIIYTTDIGEIIIVNLDGVTYIKEDGTSEHFPDGIMKKIVGQKQKGG